MSNPACLDSISNLESSFHHAFMRSRQNLADFVYVENTHLTKELDDFCDVDAMHQPKGPIVLLGECGVGKSAFLANWITRRKKLFQNWQTAFPEFIFYHVVGCSRASCMVSNVLNRLLHEMKDYFELNKEIPDVEERLSWQFPKFLDAASRKGRVIIIIDGLQRLRTNDGESILKWVPIIFPPNVRLIFTVTTKYPDFRRTRTALETSESNAFKAVAGFDHHPYVSTQLIERIKLEAIRRNWIMVQLDLMAPDEREKVVSRFLEKCQLSCMSLTRSASDLSSNPTSPVTSKGLKLQLVQLQQKAIVSIPLSSNPQFLECFLSCLAWAVGEGFDVHKVFENWLSADSLSQLLESILRSMESGFKPSRQDAEDAKQFIAEQNGMVTSRSRRRSSLIVGEEQVSAQVRRASSAGQDNTLDLTFLSEMANQYDEPQASTGISQFTFEPVDKLSTHTSQGTSAEEGANILKSTPGRDTREVYISTSRDHQGAANGSKVGNTDEAYPSEGSSLSQDKRKPRAWNTNDRRLGRHKDDALSFVLSGDKIPEYFTGGSYVPSMGKLLKPALCLLHVCRQGLLVNELRYILNAIISEEKEGLGERNRRKKSTYDKNNPNGGDMLSAFTETEWQALLRAFKPLGVLFVHDVVAIPVCKESLREVIWWRYIGTERVQQKYHHWLIRFFKSHPTTFRRVEELPWHLRRCYQWTALRNVLTNLPMFQLLYTPDYKNELFGYWKLLSAGPLYIYSLDKPETSIAPTYMIPFDIVKEYSKSIEEWYKSVRPRKKTFTATIELVSKFMYEFCAYYQGYLPPFSHAPLDLTQYHKDGYKFVDYLPHLQSSGTSVIPSVRTSSEEKGNSNASSSNLASAPEASASSLVISLSSCFDSFATLNKHIKSKEAHGNWYYCYQRWVWINIPWLAVGREISIREPFVSPNNVFPSSQIYNGGAAGEWRGLPPIGGSTQMTNGNNNFGNSEDSGHLCSSMMPRPFTESHQNASIQSSRTSHKYWEARSRATTKQTMDIKQKAMMTPGKLASIQNTSVHLSTTPSSILPTEFLISPDQGFMRKATFTAVKNVLSSSAKALASATPSNTILPALGESLSQPVLTAIQSSRDKEDELEISKALCNPKNSVQKELCSTAFTGLTATNAYGLPAHFQDYPQTESELKKSYSHQVMLKLQVMYDNVRQEMQKKQAHLKSLKAKLREMEQHYTSASRDREMAQHAISEMTIRMEKVDRMVQNIDKQQKGYSKLLQSCEVYPACEPEHFDSIKKQLKLFQMKQRDLIEERKALQVKREHLQSKEVPALRQAVGKNKKLVGTVVGKLEKARDKMKYVSTAADQQFQERLDMIDNVQLVVRKRPENDVDSALTSVKKSKSNEATRSIVAKVAIQQCQAVCDKIQIATGVPKLESILQMLQNRDELNESFEEQAKVYEARLKQIKIHKTELEQQLHALKLSNNVIATEDPRSLEEKVREAELELARVDRAQGIIFANSKEIIAGACRIVQVLGITSTHCPFENVIPAARLWPIPQALDTGSSLSTEFEMLPPKDMIALLQICQDRVIAMVDAIEGGRSDPDAEFSLQETNTKRARLRLQDAVDSKLLSTRLVRQKRASIYNLNATERNPKEKERNFDRGTVPPVGAYTTSVPQSKGDANEEDFRKRSTEYTQVRTRDEIKEKSAATLKAKLSQKRQTLAHRMREINELEQS